VSNAIFQVPVPANEPVFDHAPGSAERIGLQNTLREMAGPHLDILLVIGGDEVRTRRTSGLPFGGPGYDR